MKIGVVGCGMVGSTSAYALVMSGVGRDTVRVDVNRARAEAQAQRHLSRGTVRTPVEGARGGVRGSRRSTRGCHRRRRGAEAE
jgi:malate/lactate dehydrogenase